MTRDPLLPLNGPPRLARRAIAMFFVPCHPQPLGRAREWIAGTINDGKGPIAALEMTTMVAQSKKRGDRITFISSVRCMSKH